MFAGGTNQASRDKGKGNGKGRSYKAPCWAFAKGKCTRGEGCRFRHGGSSARPTDQDGTIAADQLPGVTACAMLCRPVVPEVTYASVLIAGRARPAAGCGS